MKTVRFDSLCAGLGALLVCGAMLAACSTSPPAPSGQHKAKLVTSRTIPWAKLGHRPEAQEREAAGPSALAVGRNGAVYLLDALRERIVELGERGFTKTISVPRTVEDLALGDDGAFLVYSPLRARAWVYGPEGDPAGELKVPRALRMVQHLSFGPSRQIRAHNAYQETFRLGSPATPQTLAAVLHARRAGAYPLDDEHGVVVVLREDGRPELRIIAARQEKRAPLRRFLLDDEAIAARVVGVAQGVVCLRLEQADGAARGPLEVRRQAVCLDAATGRERLRVALPAPGDYLPRRELALGGSPLRLVHIGPRREGLAITSWQLGE